MEQTESNVNELSLFLSEHHLGCVENITLLIWAICAVIVTVCIAIYSWKWFFYWLNTQKSCEEMTKAVTSGSRYVPSLPIQSLVVQDKPWWYQARIYQIMVDRFNGSGLKPTEDKEKLKDFLGGTIKGITEKLDYIKGLGYDTIMLTPIFKTEYYHGYHTTDYEEIDRHFGRWQDFQQLIEKTHQNGLRIICDFVPNHCSKSHPFFKEALKVKDSPKRKWFYFDKKGNYATFLHYKELPKFNLNNEEVAEYMIQAAERLLYYGVDGIRIDHVIGLPFEFIGKLSKRLKSKKSDFFIIGEATSTSINDFTNIEFLTDNLRVLAENNNLSQDQLQLQYVGILDGVLDFTYWDIIRKNIGKEGVNLYNKELVDELEAHFSLYPKDFALVTFLDNHDTERITYIAKQNKDLVHEAVMFTRALPYPSCTYYGTEQYMTHQEPVINGKPYADVFVREPMDWSRVGGNLVKEFLKWVGMFNSNSIVRFFS